jgi:hypothetical protein
MLDGKLGGKNVNTEPRVGSSRRYIVRRKWNIYIVKVAAVREAVFVPDEMDQDKLKA